MYTLIGPFKQIITMRNLPLKGSLADDRLEIIENGAILIQNDSIHTLGSLDQVESKAMDLNAKQIRLSGDHICLPGYLDAHTHICFAGSRANDYAMRNAGSSYLEIAKAGGGIWDSVTQTRNASGEMLKQGIEQRARKMLQNGITTIEVKSGYGLSVQEELKMLRAINAAQTTSDLIPTCLAAHILPKDFEGGHTAYLNMIAEDLFPILKSEGLTDRIDVFIEEEAFDVKNVGPYFNKAKELGFSLTVHADQFSPGGSAVAVQYGALSADHLEASTDKEIELLANSDVIAMALPGATLGLGCAFTPARKLLDAGASLAIASDWNPGSGPMGDLITQAAILGSFQKLSNAEVLAGITYRAAAALDLNDRGTIDENKLADLVIYKVSHFNEILYHQGQLKPVEVWKRGKVI